MIRFSFLSQYINLYFLKNPQLLFQNLKYAFTNNLCLLSSKKNIILHRQYKYLIIIKIYIFLLLPLYDFFHSLLLYTNYSHKIQFITFVLNKLCHLLGQLRRKKIVILSSLFLSLFILPIYSCMLSMFSIKSLSILIIDF